MFHFNANVIISTQHYKKTQLNYFLPVVISYINRALLKKKHTFTTNNKQRNRKNKRTENKMRKIEINDK